MTIQEECELSFYEKLTDLGTHENVYLVQHIETKKIYVRKDLKHYDIDVMKSIMRAAPKGMPVIYFCAEDESGLHVIEEYIQGENLGMYIKMHGCMSDAQAVRLGIFLCEALERLHLMKPPIIHCDIKPSNIILAENGDYTLLDFNAAKFSGYNKYCDREVLGTRGYAAPEQYNYDKATEQTDVYSIGATLNYLLTGETVEEGIAKGRLGDIITKCCAGEKAGRYPGVRELKLALSLNSREKEEEKHPGGRVFLAFLILSIGILLFVWFLNSHTSLYVQSHKVNQSEETDDAAKNDKDSAAADAADDIDGDDVGAGDDITMDDGGGDSLTSDDLDWKAGIYRSETTGENIDYAYIPWMTYEIDDRTIMGYAGQNMNASARNCTIIIRIAEVKDSGYYMFFSVFDTETGESLAISDESNITLRANVGGYTDEYTLFNKYNTLFYSPSFYFISNQNSSVSENWQWSCDTFISALYEGKDIVGAFSSSSGMTYEFVIRADDFMKTFLSDLGWSMDKVLMYDYLSEMWEE